MPPIALLDTSWCGMAQTCHLLLYCLLTSSSSTVSQTLKEGPTWGRKQVLFADSTITNVLQSMPVGAPQLALGSLCWRRQRGGWCRRGQPKAGRNIAVVLAVRGQLVGVESCIMLTSIKIRSRDIVVFAMSDRVLRPSPAKAFSGVLDPSNPFHEIVRAMVCCKSIPDKHTTVLAHLHFTVLIIDEYKPANTVPLDCGPLTIAACCVATDIAVQRIAVEVALGWKLDGGTSTTVTWGSNKRRPSGNHPSPL